MHRPSRTGPVEYDSDAIAVRDALRTLPERQREALVLRYFLGRIDREIADAMGCPVGTVKSLIHRGLVKDEGDAEMTDVEDRVECALHLLAERFEPDVETALARLGSRAGSTAPPARRLLRPQVWVTVAAATVAVVGVGSLWAVGTRSPRPCRPSRHSSPPDPREPAPARSRRPPSSSSSVEPRPPSSTPPRTSDTGAAGRARPSARRGPDPFRSRPRLGARHDGVVPASVVHPAIRRWHADRRCLREPVGGEEWATTFHDAPSAGIAGR